MVHISRNDPCPCGSQKKYKKCCGDTRIDKSLSTYYHWRSVDGEYTELIKKFVTDYIDDEDIGWAVEEFGIEQGVDDAIPEDWFLNVFEKYFFYDWKISSVLEPHPFDNITMAQAVLSMSKAYKTTEMGQLCKAVENAPHSSYLVLNVIPDLCMTLRNLLREEEVIAYDFKASQPEIQGSILYARVVTLDDISFFMGSGGAMIPTNQANFIIQTREEICSSLKQDSLTNQDLLHFSEKLRFLYLDICHSLSKPFHTRLRNTDGDPLEIHKLHYQISSAEEAFNALKVFQQKVMKYSDQELMEQATFKDGKLYKIDLKWLRVGNKNNPHWENTLLGDLNIEGETLTVIVNSAKRSKKIQKEISKRLGPRAMLIKTEIENTEAHIERIKEGPTTQSDKHKKLNEHLMSIPEIQKKLKELTSKHWDEWLDHPLPALNGMTPRKAAKDKVGRELLEMIFIDFENKIRNSTLQPAFAPNVPQLKKELGF